MRTLGLACALALALPALTLAQDDRRQAPPAATIAQLDSLEWVRGIEWGGDHIQTRLRITRQADGTHLADFDGEDVKHPAQGVVVPAEEVERLKAALAAMLSFPDDGFGGDGNHWFTDIRAAGSLAGGQPLAFKRYFYDANSDGVMRQAGAFEDAVQGLISRLSKPPAAPAAGGLAGSLPD